MLLAEVVTVTVREMNGDTPSGDPPVVSFDDIVRAQFEISGMESEMQFFTPEGQEEEAIRRHDKEARLNKLWNRFQQHNGEIVVHHFGRRGLSGAALTVSRRARLGWIHRSGRPQLHIVLDLATAGPAAELVSRCERVRVKADQLLSGSERIHVTRVVYDRVCQLMRIVDASLSNRLKSESMYDAAFPSPFPGMSEDERKSYEDERARREKEHARWARIQKAEDARLLKEWTERVDHALKVAEAEVIQTEGLCDRAVRRVALMAYFVGMLAGVGVFTLLGVTAGVFLSKTSIQGFQLQAFLTAFIAGAVGAIVSVMSRMSSGQSTLEYETGRGYLRVLGAFRPLIGAIFGVALYFAIASALLPAKVPMPGSDSRFFFFAIIAFLAGFSERWAQDMLVVSRRGIGTTAGSPGLDPGARPPD